ncbi:FecR family protein [Qipengyuania qiaonensis]|uniref:FecR domain-containing protein n=1 Tax=Qipengyuania qiaonensis TaxID=2867240 RepID=A0ABS7J8W2_9SPHN|nr:FecR domain-containing protein [Qipengyuania qiaonensis]MBX7482400.1 FecR domain-containing protein [Qipengyuania qiaonensis]
MADSNYKSQSGKASVITTSTARFVEALEGGDPAALREYRQWLLNDDDRIEPVHRSQDIVAAFRENSQLPEIAELRAATRERVAGAANDNKWYARAGLGAAIAASIAVLLLVTSNFLNIAEPQSTKSITIAENSSEPEAEVPVNTPAPVEVAQPSRDVYSTRTGEVSDVRLADGSLVTLDTASRVVVSYSEGKRMIELVRGRALFDVAHDPDRPFVVRAGDKQVVALGTTFDVSLEPEGLSVTLVEGKVRVDLVSPSNRISKLADLSPGQQFSYLRDRQAKVLPVDAARLTSWKRGMLVFDNVRMDEAVADMNRYLERDIVLEGSGIAQRRISGSFEAGNGTDFAQALSEYFDLEQSDESVGRIILRPRRQTLDGDQE